MTPEGDRVHAHLLGSLFHDALQQIGGFGPPGAPVGIHRHRVGQRTLHFAPNARNLVQTGKQSDGKGRGDQGRERRQVGTLVRPGLHMQAGNGARRVHRHPDVGHMVPTLRISHE